MAVYVRIINQMTNATDGDIRGPESDFLQFEGVVDLSAGHLLITQADTPGMSVKYAQGKAYVKNDSFTEFSSNLKFWDVVVDATGTVAISSNASGSTRFDLVCLKIDTGATPDANASNVASVAVVQGTPGAGEPALPTNHLLLAVVEVSDGATSIVNADIEDSREQIGFNPDFIEVGSRQNRVVGVEVFSGDQDVAIGDDAGDAFFRVSSELNSWVLLSAAAQHRVAGGGTGVTAVQIRNVTQAVDMLSTKVTVDATEKDSITAAAPMVVHSNNADVSTGNQLVFDVDTLVSGTAPKGLFIEMIFRPPTVS